MTDNSEQPGHKGVRIGDAEREEAVNRLGEHYAAGRLTEEEHAERSQQAYEARTKADLDALFADLPGGQQDEGQQGPQWGPPWAQGGKPPWAQHGTPPWAAAWGAQQGGRPPFRGGKGLRWLPVPFLVLAAFFGVCAIVHGFFPFMVVPLIGIALTLFLLDRFGVLRGQHR